MVVSDLIGQTRLDRQDLVEHMPRMQPVMGSNPTQVAREEWERSSDHRFTLMQQAES